MLYSVIIVVLLFNSVFPCFFSVCFFFNDTATTEIYTLSLHDALPIFSDPSVGGGGAGAGPLGCRPRSEEHTSELQSPVHLVCRLLLEKKKKKSNECLARVKTKKKTARNAQLKIQ